jgi:hypothetical protein
MVSPDRQGKSMLFFWSPAVLLVFAARVRQNTARFLFLPTPPRPALDFPARKTHLLEALA